jgi:hypothetical protein
LTFSLPDDLYRICIRLRTLSTGEKHPLAESTAALEHTKRVATMTGVGPERDPGSYFIQICGDYIGILFNAGHIKTELVVWSWKTGVKNLMVNIVCPHYYSSTIDSPIFFLKVLGTNLKSFVFLNDNFILGSSCRRIAPPTLPVYRLEQRPADDTTPVTSTHFLRFLLGPRFMGPRRDSYVLLVSDPSPGWLPNAVPFHTAGDERMIAMYSNFLDDWWGTTCLISAKALLRQIESYDYLPLEEELDVEWEVHGPQLIELFPEDKEWDVESWPYSVFGMRYILPCADGLQDGISKVLIRDLSPRRCLRASKEEREESDALYEVTSWPSSSTCKPDPRSILMRVPLAGNINLNGDTRFLISEDGIVVVETVRETLHLHSCATNTISL